MDDVSDPDDKEISEDDDDRNHKHRRREEYSQSLDGDSSGQYFTRPYRRQNKNFGNGHPLREGGFSSSDTWKNYNDGNQETDLPVRFDKRRQNIPSFSRGTDTNQRTRTNLSMSTDSGPAKGRGRDSVMYGQRDSRFRQVDIAAQLVQHGPIPPNLFSGRGLPTLPHVPGRSWNAFGFIPAIPGRGLDPLHSIGLQVSLRPPINPSWGIGIPRQRCRDFEELGFCLRGDMCPMEHGVNHIVVDDVQSLSQFNLPAVNVLGTSAGQGSLPTNASTSTFMSNKGLQIKNGKRGLTDDGMGLNSTFVGSSVVGVADFYDPDQPLWTNNGPEIGSARMAVSGSNFNEVEPLTTGKDASGQHPVALSDGTPSDIPRTSAETAAASQSSSAWRRNGGSKIKSEVRPKTDSTLVPPSSLENDEMKKNTDLVEIPQGVNHQEQEMNTDDAGSHVPFLSSKPLSDPGYNFRRPYQKASRTLFVSGIPPKENRREALLSHFKKFGVVIDIYIPLNSERAFVQFSKKEEAETALKSPDAIMGNRFIKISWANRDNKPDHINGGPNIPSDSTKGVTVASGPPSLPASVRGHDNVQIPAIKGSASNVYVASSKPIATKPTIISPKAPPQPSQKKMETLELLKEELRKKQEMLDQKRNEFKRQLDKLEKQATSLKDGESNSPSKRHKSEAVVDSMKIESSEIVTDSGSLSLPLSEKINDSSRSGVDVVSRGSKSTVSNPALPESRSLKQPLGTPFISKYKLDNRPTVFIVCPPLPACLATASALKEHFSCYGELAYADLGTSKDKDNNPESDAMTMSARIAYKTRQSAEKAFLNGKNWQGHELEFKWEEISGGGKVSKENPSSLTEQSLDADIQSSGEIATTIGVEIEISAAPENMTSEKINIQEEEKMAPRGDEAVQ